MAFTSALICDEWGARPDRLERGIARLVSSRFTMRNSDCPAVFKLLTYAAARSGRPHRGCQPAALSAAGDAICIVSFGPAYQLQCLEQESLGELWRADLPNELRFPTVRPRRRGADVASTPSRPRHDASRRIGNRTQVTSSESRKADAADATARCCPRRHS